MGDQLIVTTTTKITLELNGSSFELTVAEAEQLCAKLNEQISALYAAKSTPQPQPWEWPRKWPWDPGVHPGDSPSNPFPLMCGALWEVRPSDLPQYTASSSVSP